MSTKPILFNTEMVRAIQADRKTVTRRVVKPQPTYSPNSGFSWKGAAYGTDLPPTAKGAAHNFRCACPYRPGDILYVRETWAEWSDLFGEFPEYIYRADYSNEALKRDDCTEEVNSDFPDCVKWHPSIHMPREAARIFLRVTDVRVERIKDATELDAKAEGFSSRAEFIEAILKMYPDCTENSWMWVIEFERISR